MGISIAYMGTKRQLASAVSEVISAAQPGTLFDAFSGMCSVGQTVAPARQIWTNDAQIFASEVGAALFTSQDSPIDATEASDLAYGYFKQHRDKLKSRYPKSLMAEERALTRLTFSAFEKCNKSLQTEIRNETPKHPRRSGNLFVTYYSNTYFGVRQAIEIDSVRCAIERLFRENSISTDQKRWLLIALGKTLLRVSNSTGHFAQFLKPNENSYRVYVRKRLRRVWSEWLTELEGIGNIGTKAWRRNNKAFNTDSLTLLTRLASEKKHPSVIYADPPYTDDQYSRYYHVLETLLLYDYPKLSGAGLYRSDRFATTFSKKTSAIAALDEFIRATARLGADLVLSYPTNGLIYEAGTNPKALLKKYFAKVEIGHSQSHLHSTFGASKGTAQESVTERIYLAKT